MTWRPTIARWRGKERNRLLSVVFSPPPFLLHQLSDKEPLQNSDGRIRASAVAHYASSFVCCCRHHSSAFRKLLNCCHCCVFNLAFLGFSFGFSRFGFLDFRKKKILERPFGFLAWLFRFVGIACCCWDDFMRFSVFGVVPQSGESRESKARSVVCFHEDSSAVDSLSVPLSSSPLKF